MQIPANRDSRTYWSLHAVGVRAGVPTGKVLLDGFVGNLRPDCTVEEILEALDAAVRGALLH
jgi:hypothetical protein